MKARDGIPGLPPPGHASDHKEALKNLERLKRLLKKKDFLIIGDRAMITRNRVGLPARKACQFGQAGTLYVPHAGHCHIDGQRSVIQQIGNIQPFMHEILGALNVRPLDFDDANTG